MFLESLSSGVPVITTNATGAVDSVGNGIRGLVVEKNSPPQLSKGMARLTTDDSLRGEPAKNARPWVIRRFSQSLGSTALEGFLAGLIETRGSR